MDNKKKVEIIKAILKAKKEKQPQNEPIKTTETPQPMKPIEKAMALRRKTDNKYANYIASKTLTGLDD